MKKALSKSNVLKTELLPVRDAQVLKERDQDTFTHFNREALTFQQYRTREMILRETPQCRRAFRIWGLMHGKTTVASVEVFSLPFVFRGLRYVAWNLTRLIVKPEYQKQGFARRLLDELLERAKSERISMLMVFADPEQHAFFKLLGFHPRPNYLASYAISQEPVAWPGGVVPDDERAPLNQRSGVEVAFVVDEALTFWHRSRAHVHARIFEQRYVEVSGARLRGAHVLWTPEWCGSSLRILYQSPAAPEVATRLMQAAVSHAQKFSLQSMTWVKPRYEHVDILTPDTVIENPIVPMIYSLDPEISADLLSVADSVLCV